ncbi:MAG: HAD-IA family hydrolase [Planctomycetota bacterium]
MHPKSRRSAEAIDAVVFDCDGTLVDSEKVSLSVLAQLVGEHGLALEAEEAIRRFSGQDLKLVFRDLEAELGTTLPTDIIEVFRGRQIPQLKRSLEAIEGADALLSGLRLPACVASNAPQSKIRVCLETTGLIRHFDTHQIFSAYDIQRWKPDPALFQLAARSLNVPPERCAVVEDSIFGIQAALAAGMQTFVLDPHDRFGEFDDQLVRVGSLVELRPFLSPDR